MHNMWPCNDNGHDEGTNSIIGGCMQSAPSSLGDIKAINFKEI